MEDQTRLAPPARDELDDALTARLTAAVAGNCANPTSEPETIAGARRLLLAGLALNGKASQP